MVEDKDFKCSDCGRTDMEELISWWDVRLGRGSYESYCDKCADKYCPQYCEHLKGE